MKTVIATLLVLSAVHTAHAQEAPGLVLTTVERLGPSDLEIGQRQARMRAGGTVLLTLGATLIPTTASLWIAHAPGHDICVDSCGSSTPSSPAIDGVFGGALVLEHVAVGAGRYLVTAGYGPSGGKRVGTTSTGAKTLIGVGSALIVVANVLLPIGILVDNQYTGLLASFGAGTLAAGVPLAAAGSYRDNTNNPVSLGAAPLVRAAGDPPGRTVTGMTTTVSGRF